MWQQSDCSIHNATEDNPTGCLNDLYPFVITTYAGLTAASTSSSAPATTFFVRMTTATHLMGGVRDPGTSKHEES